VNSFVSDYNSLVSAMNTQEGVDSSGNAEPLFGFSDPFVVAAAIDERDH